VIRVDPVTGSQTVVSSNGIFNSAFGIGIALNGDIFVADTVGHAVIRVDPMTGAQTIVSSGGNFMHPGGVAIFQGPTVINTSIDIKPGSFPNSINLSSAGVVPVAILSSATFDATQVDAATVTLAGAAVKLIGKANKFSCSIQYVNEDGLPDLLCHVLTDQLQIAPGDSAAVLKAKTLSGQDI
jgi:hypothetical protein